MKDRKQQPLSCDLEDGQLVVRIGIETLKHAAENSPVFYGHEGKSYPPYVKVVDSKQLAKDVRRELTREKEDGETPLHRLFDEAIRHAFDDGSIAFEDDQ